MLAACPLRSESGQANACLDMSAWCRLCCKSIFGIWSRNIDSRSGTNKQQRFKRAGALIRLLQISISQSLLGDFCNTIGTKRTNRDKRSLVRFRSEADIARPPLAYRPVADDPQPTKAPSKSRSAVGLPQCYLPLRTGEIADETARVYHAAWRRDGCVAGRGARAAPGDAGDRGTRCQITW